MTKDEIRQTLVAIDGGVKHYWSAGNGKAYTYWEETDRLPFMRDDMHEEAWAFTVHRFTKDEYDDVADRIFDALDREAGIAVRHSVDYEPDTGYIHHIYDCEAI